MDSPADAQQADVVGGPILKPRAGAVSYYLDGKHLASVALVTENDGEVGVVKGAAVVSGEHGELEYRNGGTYVRERKNV